MAASIEKIEERINRDVVGQVGMGRTGSGRSLIQFANLGEVLEFAKVMSTAQGMVPRHLIGNPGACVGIVLQAIDWGFSPYAVAQKSYIAKDGQPLAYESQLIHAVIEKNAPLVGRLKHRFEGAGDATRCIVWGTLRKLDTVTQTWIEEECTFKSETLAKLRPRLNDQGDSKGSPLWQKKPEVQLFYNASRDWARIYCPDVLLGAYSIDEMREIDAKPAKTAIANPFDDEASVIEASSDANAQVSENPPETPAPSTSPGGIMALPAPDVRAALDTDLLAATNEAEVEFVLAQYEPRIAAMSPADNPPDLGDLALMHFKRVRGE